MVIFDKLTSQVWPGLTKFDTSTILERLELRIKMPLAQKYFNLELRCETVHNGLSNRQQYLLTSRSSSNPTSIRS